MSNRNGLFIGFPTFEGLLDAADKNKTVYLLQKVTTTPAHMNTELVSWTVNAAVISEHICLYWQMYIGTYNRVDGTELFRDSAYEKGCDKRCEQVETLLGEYAREQGFRVIPGLITFPKNIVLLRGGTKVLDYDTETNSFTRREQADAAKAAMPAAAAAGG